MLRIFKKKDDKKELITAVAGTIRDLKDTYEKDFLPKHDVGFSIEAIDGEIVSPIEGDIIKISPTQNAFTIKGDDITVIVQIGEVTDDMVDGVFDPKVHKGNHINKGDVICDVDMIKFSDLEIKYKVFIMVSADNDLDFYFKKSAGRADDGTILLKWR